MVQAINDALESFSTDLTSAATSALVIGGAGLLVWVGWRLVCKLTNRSVGK